MQSQRWRTRGPRCPRTADAERGEFTLPPERGTMTSAATRTTTTRARGPSKSRNAVGIGPGIQGSHATSASHSGALSSRLSRSAATTATAPTASAASTQAGGSNPGSRRSGLARERDDAKRRPRARSPRERRRNRCRLHLLLASVGAGLQPCMRQNNPIGCRLRVDSCGFKSSSTEQSAIRQFHQPG